MIRYEESKRKREEKWGLISLSIRGRKRAKRGKVSKPRSPEGHVKIQRRGDRERATKIRFYQDTPRLRDVQKGNSISYI